MGLAICGLIFGLDAARFLAPDSAIASRCPNKILLAIRSVIQSPTCRKQNNDSDGGGPRERDGMMRQVLRLQGPELWHHGGESVNVIKAKSLMRAVKCLKEPVGAVSNLGQEYND